MIVPLAGRYLSFEELDHLAMGVVVQPCPPGLVPSREEAG
jgi:hypothetical protein